MRKKRRVFKRQVIVKIQDSEDNRGGRNKSDFVASPTAWAVVRRPGWRHTKVQYPRPLLRVLPA